MSEVSEYYYRIKVQFSGANYCGWQIQPNVRTVQGELNKALEAIFKSKNIKSIGSGRTDTGVHSLCHIVRVSAPANLDEIALLKGLNSLLPKDILVLDVSYSSADFLPTNHATSREYFYLFSNERYGAVLTLDMMSNISFKLDFPAMQKACEVFIGTYDFKSFMCTGSEVSSTERTVYTCAISHSEEPALYGVIPPHFKLDISANGFLKQMVRCIVGAIWEVGKGKLTVGEIKQELLSPSGKNIAPVAPAAGLFKANVTY